MYACKANAGVAAAKSMVCKGRGARKAAMVQLCAAAKQQQRLWCQQPLHSPAKQTSQTLSIALMRNNGTTSGGSDKLNSQHLRLRIARAEAEVMHHLQRRYKINDCWCGTLSLTAVKALDRILLLPRTNPFQWTLS
jgi:hypothetical protein